MLSGCRHSSHPATCQIAKTAQYRSYGNASSIANDRHRKWYDGRRSIVAARGRTDRRRFQRWGQFIVRSGFGGESERDAAREADIGAVGR